MLVVRAVLLIQVAWVLDQKYYWAHNIYEFGSSSIENIKKGKHKVLHTNAYYTIVNVSLAIGYVVDGEEGVKAVLKFWKETLGQLFN